MKSLKESLTTGINEARSFKYSAKDLAAALEDILDELKKCENDEVAVEVDNGNSYAPVFNLLDNIKFEKSTIEFNHKYTHRLIL